MELFNQMRIRSQIGWSRAIQKAIACVLVCGGLVCAAQPALAKFIEQGPKQVASGNIGPPELGNAVAVSSDGNTAIVGGSDDNNQVGAAWVFIRSGGVWTQQQKLVGTPAIGNLVHEGASVALSADGNTALIGAPGDNSDVGAAWIFTRSNGVWTQQQKLIGSGATGTASQGTAVALSADGTIAIVGGPNNASPEIRGAAWVFTLSSGVWTQQTMLVGNDGGTAICGPGLGASVALSADGSTAVLGYPADVSACRGTPGVGSVWVFTQSAGVWSQQGAKLVGSGTDGNAAQGTSVAVSADGNTLVEGGPFDDISVGLPQAGIGAVWVFTRSGGVWSQQGSKLVGTGFVADSSGEVGQGSSVGLSGDGNTAIMGGPYDNSLMASGDNRQANGGAVWVFTRTGGVWSQQGSPLLGADSIDSNFGVEQGTAVALSADGNTATVGGPGDNSGNGAFWIFVRGSAHDFNADRNSDIVWRDTSGDVAMWLMNGGSVLQSSGLGNGIGSLAIVGQHDFNGDSNADLLWRDTSGDVSMWFMNGVSVASAAAVGNVPSNWTLYGTGDLNGDGIGDLLWRDSISGSVAAWFMNGATVASTTSFGAVPSNWTILGDVNGYILWRDAAGDIAIWGVQNGQVASSNALGNVTSNFVVQGFGDFNGGGFPDILWRDSNSGTLSIWFTNGTQVTSAASVATLPSNWNVAQIGDYNGDGMSDILFLDNVGDLAVWLMNGATVSSSLAIGNVGTTWQVQNTNAN